MAIDPESLKARLHARLLELASEDRAAEDGTAPVTLDQESVGRLSRMDALQVQAMALAARDRRSAERRRIQAALVRLDTEDFGLCQICGEEIAEKRLLNDPAVATCIRCA